MDRRKIMTIVAAVAIIIVSAGFGLRTMGPVVSAYWHASFPSGPEPEVVASPAGPVAPVAPVTPGTGNAPAAARALADLEAELTPEKVAADPLTAVSKYTQIATDYPGTPAAERASVLARPLQEQNKGALGQANANALAEIARVISETRPRLERLEHRSVVVVWRDLETRFSGLPAAARAAAEREKVQSAWDALPKIELEAAQRFAALPPEPKVAEDAAKRLEIAAGADAIVERYHAAKFAAVAARYRDEQLDKFVASLIEVAQRSPAAARQLGAQMPGIFQDTDQAKRVLEILAALKD